MASSNCGVELQKDGWAVRSFLEDASFACDVIIDSENDRNASERCALCRDGVSGGEYSIDGKCGGFGSFLWVLIGVLVPMAGGLDTVEVLGGGVDSTRDLCA